MFRLLFVFLQMHCIRCPCSRDQRVAQKDALQDIAGKKISIDDSDGV